MWISGCVRLSRKSSERPFRKGRNRTMVELKVKARPIGATAVLGRLGHPQVTSETKGSVDVVTGASEVGFNPLDLMFSSLAACLVLSARIAASKLGMLDRFREVN